MPHRLASCLVFLAVVSMAAAGPVCAQQRQGDVGLGGQLGEPTGVTLRLYDRSRFVYDFLAAWDLDDFFFLNAHGLLERPLEDSPLNYYYGPGVIFGILRRGGDNDVVVGVSVNGGINYFVERFEVFIQLTPRLNLIPSTDIDIGGGIGLRYYF